MRIYTLGNGCITLAAILLFFLLADYGYSIAQAVLLLLGAIVGAGLLVYTWKTPREDTEAIGFALAVLGALLVPTPAYLYVRTRRPHPNTRTFSALALTGLNLSTLVFFGVLLSSGSALAATLAAAGTWALQRLVALQAPDNDPLCAECL